MFDWVGWTVPGIPFGGIGCNRNVAYAITQNSTLAFHHFFSDTTGAVNEPSPVSIDWGTTSRTVVAEPVTLTYRDDVTGAQVPYTTELRWVDAEKVIPVYVSARAVNDPPEKHRDYWVVAPSFFRPQSHFEHWFKVASAPDLAAFQSEMAKQTQTWGNMIAADRFGSLGYWHQGVTPLRTAAGAASTFALATGYLEEATDDNIVHPHLIGPFSQRPQAFHDAVTGNPTNPLWVCNNAPPREVAPPLNPTSSMQALTANYPWILPPSPVTYPAGDPLYPADPNYPLWPSDYRNGRTRTVTMTSGNTLSDVAGHAVDTYFSRGMKLAPYWIEIMDQMIGSTPGTLSLVWPGYEDFGIPLMRQALVDWTTTAQPGFAPPSGPGSRGAAMMALLEASVEAVVKSTALKPFCNVFGVNPRWILEPFDTNVPPLATWQALPPLMMVSTAPGPGSMPADLTGDYADERMVMAWAVAFANKWLYELRTLYGTTSSDNLINEEYWLAAMNSPTAFVQPWGGASFLGTGAAGIPVLETDPFNLSGSMTLNMIPELGMLKCLDWGMRESRFEGPGYLVGAGDTQFILPVGGAPTALFVQGLAWANLKHEPTIWLNNGTNGIDPRYYAPGSIGSSLQQGVHYDSRAIGGSQCLMIMQLDPLGGPPKVKIMPAIGATEIVSIDVRYATSKSFSTLTPFDMPSDPAQIPANVTTWKSYTLP